MVSEEGKKRRVLGDKIGRKLKKARKVQEAEASLSTDGTGTICWPHVGAESIILCVCLCVSVCACVCACLSMSVWWLASTLELLYIIWNSAKIAFKGMGSDGSCIGQADRVHLRVS